MSRKVKHYIIDVWIEDDVAVSNDELDTAAYDMVCNLKQDNNLESESDTISYDLTYMSTTCVDENGIEIDM